MSGPFHGKVALVTGASRGIGRDVALRLAELGAEVIAAARGADAAAATAESLRASGGRARPVVLDVASDESVRSAVSELLEAYGSIPLLVNNAGITRDGLLVRMSGEDLDAVLDVNLKGCFHFAKAAARPMMKARRGRIINVSSVIGIVGNQGQTNYAAAKAGIFGFSKSLAKELASRNILVNAVAPGFIETAMTEGLPESVKERMMESIPLGRFGSSEDVAGVVSFLASEDASYVTGLILAVDGGMVG